MATTVISPYGQRKPHHGGAIHLAIDIVLEKIRSNIKIEQFSRPNTLLVVDLCLLQVIPGGRENLRPLFSDSHVDRAKVSGVLWTVAFGAPELPTAAFANSANLKESRISASRLASAAY